jgi:hypothetical protein
MVLPSFIAELPSLPPIVQETQTDRAWLLELCALIPTVIGMGNLQLGDGKHPKLPITMQ